MTFHNPGIPEVRTYIEEIIFRLAWLSKMILMQCKKKKTNKQQKRNPHTNGQQQQK